MIAFQYWARKGEKITCENGHPIGEIIRDIKIGEDFDPQALGNWIQEEPIVGKVPPRCSICGEWWHRVETRPTEVEGLKFGRFQYHIEDDWR
jgi:hypothetical protein